MPTVGQVVAVVDAQLGSGLLRCLEPGCGGRLARWGFGVERDLVGLGGVTGRVRPRRALCGLLPRLVDDPVLPPGTASAAGDALAVLGALHQQMPGRWPLVAGRCRSSRSMRSSTLPGPGTWPVVRPERSAMYRMRKRAAAWACHPGEVSGCE